MSGFGHRVYKNYDPRAKVIKKLAEEVFSIVGRDPLIEVTILLLLLLLLLFFFFLGGGGAATVVCKCPYLEIMCNGAYNAGCQLYTVLIPELMNCYRS